MPSSLTILAIQHNLRIRLCMLNRKNANTTSIGPFKVFPVFLEENIQYGWGQCCCYDNHCNVLWISVTLKAFSEKNQITTCQSKQHYIFPFVFLLDSCLELGAKLFLVYRNLRILIISLIFTFSVLKKNFIYLPIRVATTPGKRLLEFSFISDRFHRVWIRF